MVNPDLDIDLWPVEPPPGPEKKRKGRPRKVEPVPVAAVDPDEDVEDSEDKQPLEEAPVTKEGFSGYLEQQMILNTPALLRELYPALQQLVKEKDREAIKLVMQMFGLVKQGGGVNIVQNVAQVGMGGLPSDRSENMPRSFESIVKVLEMRDISMGPRVLTEAPSQIPTFIPASRAFDQD